MLLPVFVRCGDLSYKFTVRTIAYSKNPILVFTKVVKVEDDGVDG